MLVIDISVEGGNRRFRICLRDAGLWQGVCVQYLLFQMTLRCRPLQADAFLIEQLSVSGAVAAVILLDAFRPSRGLGILNVYLRT